MQLLSFKDINLWAQVPEIQILPSNKEKIEKFFKVKNFQKIFEGYIDDSRNTDNAWIETSVFYIHFKKSYKWEKIEFINGNILLIIFYINQYNNLV